MHKVLFVEDEAVMRMAFHKMLNWDETEFILAGAVANGREALKYIAENPVDIVVTDLVMPVMDGLTLIKSLREQNFAGIILVLSNYTDFEHVRKALIGGAADYILKLEIDGAMLLKQLKSAAVMLEAGAGAWHKEATEAAAAIEHKDSFFEAEAFKDCRPDVRNALFFIHLHFSKKLTLDEIAESVNLNKSYICRLFKQEMGKPMFEYINDLRMEKAAALIAAGDTYIRGVAASVGIDDPFYFCRLFKKYYDVAPSVYAKKLAE